MILEVNLDNLIGETEHDRVLGSHPLLHVDRAWRVLQLVRCILFVSLYKLLLLLWVIILLKV